MNDWYEIIKPKDKDKKKDNGDNLMSDKKVKGGGNKKDADQEADECKKSDHISEYQSEPASEEYVDEESEAKEEVVEPEDIAYELNDIMNDLKKQRTRIEEIRQLLPEDVRIGMYSIDNASLKQAMMEKHWKIILKIKFLVWRLIS